MLAFLGLSSVDELFEVVPEALRLQRGLELADGVGEPDVLATMEGFAERNRARSDRLVCFAGGGAYDHEIPSVTRALAGRSEFVTSYTPYQPEVAQGVLQAVFEYQTMVARLAGLPGGQRLPLRRGQCRGRGGQPRGGRIGPGDGVGVGRDPSPLAPDAGHLRRRDRAPAGHRPPGRRGHPTGPARTGGTSDPPGVVLVGYPNYLGCIEDLAAARALCDRTGALLVVGIDPVAAGLLQLGRRVGRRRGGGGGAGLRDRPSASEAPTSGCSPAPRPTCAACPAGWWGRPSTSRAAGPT